jgi:hypothetical protein
MKYSQQCHACRTIALSLTLYGISDECTANFCSSKRKADFEFCYLKMRHVSINAESSVKLIEEQKIHSTSANDLNIV